MTVKSFLNSKAVAEILDLSNGFDPSASTETEPATENESATGKSHKQNKSKDSTPKQARTPTHELTLQLYNEGMSFAEIAKQRGLTINSIEKHVVKLIEEGKINANDFVAPRHRELIIRVMQKFTTPPLLKEIKEMLPDDITYLEIQAVRASQQFIKDNTN